MEEPQTINPKPYIASINIKSNKSAGRIKAPQPEVKSPQGIDTTDGETLADPPEVISLHRP